MMTREEILNRLKVIIKNALGEDTNVSNITGNERLIEDLGFDSISIVYMSFTMENEFGVDISKLSFKSFKTVNDVINYIIKNQK